MMQYKQIRIGNSLCASMMNGQDRTHSGSGTLLVMPPACSLPIERLLDTSPYDAQIRVGSPSSNKKVQRLAHGKHLGTMNGLVLTIALDSSSRDQETPGYSV